MLKHNLKRAGLIIKPEEFIRKTVVSSFLMTAGVVILIGSILGNLNLLRPGQLIFIPVIFLLLFLYFTKLPDAKILKRKKEISKEIVFAGRHLIIELESGIPLYDSFINIAKNYPAIGKYFKEILDKVNLGTSMEDALSEAVEILPSENFKRLLWQILNSIRTGSDISKSLTLTLEQIEKEQTIEVKDYGRKLNPLAMFYMIIAVILPTLGITLLIVISSFIQFKLSLSTLLFIACLLGFVQYMFLSIIKFARPPIDF